MDSRKLEKEPNYGEIDRKFREKEKSGLEQAFKLILTYMTDKKGEIDITSSSGSSVVFISPDSDRIIQVFSNKNLMENVCFLLSEIYRGNYMVKIKCDIEEEFDGDLEDFGEEYTTIEEIYDLPQYLVPFEVCIPESKLIVWKKIKPLNSVVNLPGFIQKNHLKLIWDLAHALEGLHSIRITHGDSTIDNVGIFNGKFVYYDFDMSKMTPPGTGDNTTKIIQEFAEAKRKDFTLLSNSIKYHTGKKEFVGSIQEILVYTMQVTGLTAEKAQEYLNNLTIQV